MTAILLAIAHLLGLFSQAGNFLGGLTHWQTFWGNVLS
jgi:hypothetical protein